MQKINYKNNFFFIIKLSFLYEIQINLFVVVIRFLNIHNIILLEELSLTLNVKLAIITVYHLSQLFISVKHMMRVFSMEIMIFFSFMSKAINIRRIAAAHLIEMVGGIPIDI